MRCAAVHTRPGGEQVRCREHDGPWHVGDSTIGRYTWPREPKRPFPYPTKVAA